jgi:glutamate synthase (NADPH/NADH) large chain
MVDLEALDEEDWQTVQQMIARHILFTKSAYAKGIQTTLADQPFVKVMPRDFKRVRLAEANARAENREPAFAELVGTV